MDGQISLTRVHFTHFVQRMHKREHGINANVRKTSQHLRFRKILAFRAKHMQSMYKLPQAGIPTFLSSSSFAKRMTGLIYRRYDPCAVVLQFTVDDVI
jgi:hypothetical protein